jgi:hypothetical protein
MGRFMKAVTVQCRLSNAVACWTAICPLPTPWLKCDCTVMLMTSQPSCPFVFALSWTKRIPATTSSTGSEAIQLYSQRGGYHLRSDANHQPGPGEGVLIARHRKGGWRPPTAEWRSLQFSNGSVGEERAWLPTSCTAGHHSPVTGRLSCRGRFAAYRFAEPNWGDGKTASLKPCCKRCQSLWRALVERRLSIAR